MNLINRNIVVLSMIYLLGFLFFFIWLVLFQLPEEQQKQQQSLLLSTELDARNLNERIEYLVRSTQLIASSLNVRQAVTESNQQFLLMETADRKAEITKLDAKWRSASEDDAFVQAVMTNSVARYLKHIQQDIVEGVGEIFVTNRYGLVVGTTGKLTTMEHEYKYWWQGAFNQNAPRVFLDDRGFDFSVKDNVLGIVVPVIKEGRFIGILKANYRLSWIFPKNQKYSFLGFNEGASGRSSVGYLTLLRSSGEVLNQSAQSRFFEHHWSVISNQLSQNTPTVFNLDSSQTMVSAPIDLTFKNNSEIGFGGKRGGVDQFKGNAGKGWFLFATQPSQTVFEVIDTSTMLILFAIWTSLIVLITWYQNRYHASFQGLLKKLKATNQLDDSHFIPWLKKTSNNDADALESEINVSLARLQSTIHAKQVYENRLETQSMMLDSIQEQNQYDPLTLVSNQTALNEQLQRYISISRRHGYSVSIVAFEINLYEHSKKVLGQQRHQNMVAELIETIRSAIREEDILARTKEAQFAILLPSTSKVAALGFSEKLKALLSNKVFEQQKVTLSIGITEYIQGDDSKQLLGRAEAALRQAKNLGRNSLFGN